MSDDEPHAADTTNPSNVQGLPEGSAEQGLTLDQLSSAFAEMLGDDRTPPAGAAPVEAGDPSGEPEVAAEDVPLAAPDEAEDAACQVSPRTILEAMLFVGSPDNRPLAGKHVASLMRGVEAVEVDQLVCELNQRYAEDGCPYHIVGEGAGYRLALRDQFSRVRDKFFGRARRVKLSQAAIEVLAITAYNQPITREQIQRQRGTASGSVLTQLVRRGLLRIERPAEKPRKPRYHTTERFLRLFGLESLDDLPRSEELDTR